MEDQDILTRIHELVDQERVLRDGDVDDLTRARLSGIEAQLDQCWDLLRQREALREAGGSPEVARVRPVDEVESYLQ